MQLPVTVKQVNTTITLTNRKMHISTDTSPTTHTHIIMLMSMHMDIHLGHRIHIIIINNRLLQQLLDNPLHITRTRMLMKKSLVNPSGTEEADLFRVTGIRDSTDEKTNQSSLKISRKHRLRLVNVHPLVRKTHFVIILKSLNRS